MRAIDLVTNQLSTLCCNNAEAMSFLNLWGDYVHGIDDLIDEKTDAEFRVGLFIKALELYNHPFFLKNRENLNPVIVLVTNTYLDSVLLEKGTKEERTVSDTLRHCGIDMYYTVAALVGGWDHLRKFSLELRNANCRKQHNEKQ